MTKRVVHFSLIGTYTTDADSNDEAVDELSDLESFNKFLKDIDEWFIYNVFDVKEEI